MIKYSFKNWCIDNNRLDLLELWGDKNNISPDEVSFKSNKKYWFKCKRNIHDEELQNIQYLPDGKQSDIYCKKCKSVAQKIIDDFGFDYFENTWDDKDLNPWDISFGSNKKAKIKCFNNSNHKYNQKIIHYANGVKCPYCCNQKISKDNSLGNLFNKSLNLWSDKNNKSPYDYAPYSKHSVWWKCENGVHEDFSRSIYSSNYCDFKCPKCAHILGGKKAREDLTGMKFGHLLVLERDEELSRERNRTFWKCLCDCGGTTSVYMNSLKDGHTTSCNNYKIHRSGENCPNWKGGLTSERQLARNNKNYYDWRKEVYKKDWYTCQCCGKSHKIEKQAHHIISFSNNEELRYDVDNGITMCRDCHYTTVKGSLHNIYGTNDVTPEQLEEYINNKRKELGIDIPFNIEEYKNGNILKPNMVNI